MERATVEVFNSLVWRAAEAEAAARSIRYGSSSLRRPKLAA